MSWLRTKLLNWLTQNTPQPKQSTSLAAIIGAEHEERHTTPKFRLTVHNAINGKLIEIGTYKHNPHGPDWTFETYILPEGQSLSEGFATVLAIKHLEQ